jgi:tetratricopeptide (TPR) repeat protein
MKPSGYPTIKLAVLVLILFFIVRTERLKPNPHYSSIFYKWGRECEDRCSLEKQKYYYQKAFYHDPSFSDAYYQLALIAEKERDYGTALQFYKKTADLDFTKHTAYFKLGLEYFQNRQLDYAIRYFKQAIRHKHNFLEAYYYLGRIYAIRKDYQSAIWHYEHTGDMSGDALLEIYLRMGVVYHLWGSKDMTLKYVDKLLDLKRHDLADQLKRFIETGQHPEYFDQD